MKSSQSQAPSLKEAALILSSTTPVCTSIPCPVTATLQAIGGKWKVLILWHLQGEKKRFSELHRIVTGISQKILTQELRDLEAEGLISREVYPIVPPRVEYSLTEFGDSLSPVLAAMKNWGLHRLERRNSSSAQQETQILREIELVSTTSGLPKPKKPLELPALA
jgi:DNA-binding HxlR family transcriptional regulator